MWPMPCACSGNKPKTAAQTFWKLASPVYNLQIWVLPPALPYLNAVVDTLSGESTLLDFVGVQTQQITHGKHLTPPTAVSGM